MSRFSKNFKIRRNQAELDFVDIELSKDNRLFIDPFAIQIKDDAWSIECGDAVRSFFSEVLTALRSGRDNRALELLDHLHEPNETHLGVSKGRPSGRGVGKDKARWLAGAIRSSRAYETGVLSDISEAALYIPFVGPDTISDLTTNIIRSNLAKYTEDQCSLHGVKTTDVAALPATWDAVAGMWVSKNYQLPIFKGRPVLLVPKYSVRQRMSLDSQEFYNHHMLNFLQQENLDNGSSLVEVLKNGRRRVTKEALKAVHPFVKDDLAEFVSKNPQVMETYKKLKGAQGAPEDTDLDRNFDPRTFGQALSQLLIEIEPGNANASAYQDLMIGILTFLFYPSLIYPVKEQPLHGGRKRIDIKFTNAGQSGFFYRALNSRQLRAISVTVECKNYSNDIGNNEIDQLLGRFGPARGFLGFSVSRTAANYGLLIKRCADLAKEDRGYILPLVDKDILILIEAAGQGDHDKIDRYLQSILDKITH